MSDQADMPREESAVPRLKWVLAGFVAIAVFLLFTEHQAHALGALPYLIVLACPLMHIFMHHGHGSDGKHRKRAHESGDQPKR